MELPPDLPEVPLPLHEGVIPHNDELEVQQNGIMCEQLNSSIFTELV